MKIIKVKNVETKENAILNVEFENGVTKKYDVKKLYKEYPEYKRLQEWGIFHWAKVDVCGKGVSWTPDHDISSNELWEGGVTC